MTGAVSPKKERTETQISPDTPVTLYRYYIMPMISWNLVLAWLGFLSLLQSVPLLYVICKSSWNFRICQKYLGNRHPWEWNANVMICKNINCCRSLAWVIKRNFWVSFLRNSSACNILIESNGPEFPPIRLFLFLQLPASLAARSENWKIVALRYCLRAICLFAAGSSTPRPTSLHWSLSCTSSYLELPPPNTRRSWSFLQKIKLHIFLLCLRPQRTHVHTYCSRLVQTTTKHFQPRLGGNPAELSSLGKKRRRGKKKKQVEMMKGRTRSRQLTPPSKLAYRVKPHNVGSHLF